MRMLGNKIECFRGETFVLKREIVDKDGIPYRLSPKFKHPFLRIRLISNDYELDGRYDKNYWLDMSGVPKLQEEPRLVSALNTSNVTTVGILYYAIVNGEREFAIKLNNAVTPYKFEFAKQFLDIDTSSWVEQKYLYDISIVDGKLMSEYLMEAYTSLYGDTNVPTDNLTLYRKVGMKRPEMVKGINPKVPLANITRCDVLMAPAKLIVNVK